MKNFIKTLIIPLLILFIRPMGLTVNQSIVLAALFLTVTWWTFGTIKKSYASLFLLAMFTLFGQTPGLLVFDFLLSETMLIIIFSYIFSQGISNSKLAQKLLEPYLYKYAGNYIKLLLVILVIQFLMIFIVPQPFSRVIIISIILKEYFNGIGLEAKAQESLMFWIHASSLFINMSLTRGDLILNTALLTISNIQIPELLWVKYMTIPSLFFYLIAATGFVFIFRKDLEKYNQAEKTLQVKREKLGKKDLVNAGIIAVVVLVWATESLHGLSGTLVVILGTIAMFASKLLDKNDLKCVDVNLLLFLTAAFSIGKVMSYSGTSSALFSDFIYLFPREFNNLYIFMIVLISMVFHMVLGSNITSLSIIIPAILLISQDIVDPIIIMFMIYVSVCGHFALPFHSVYLMIGNGNGLFGNKTTLRFSPLLTVIVFFSVYFIYLSWWRIMGVPFFP